MVRKLSLALALVLGTVPFGAHALGLGDINLKSGLNQYLDADINLLSVEPDELSDVRVSLAPVESYQRAGIDRPFHLTKLRFRPDILDDGSAVIRVTSRDPIREPFLNFLIEVNWPKGKLVREYTVLLDPPVTLGRAPTQVESPMQSSRRSSSQSSSRPAPAGPMAGENEYGPTQRNDTLWGIATKVRHAGASMQQTMIALQQANPQAFINNNINNLKRGEILRIPTREEVLGLSRAQAQAEYRAQVNEWEGSRSSTVASGAMEGQMMSGSDATGQQAAEDAELKIASARPSGEGTGGASEGSGDASIQDQQQELMATQEALASAKQEGTELQSRVSDLESQLEDLQRLLELKNTQLAQFQSALAEQENAAEEGVAETSEAMKESAAEEMTSVAEGEATESMAEGEAPAEPTPAEPGMAEGAESEEVIVLDDSAEEGMKSTETAAPAMEEKMAEPAKPEAEKPAPMAQAKPKPAPQPPAQEPSIIDTIMGDTTLLAAAGGGAVAILGLIWYGLRRRQSETQQDFQESILVSTIDEDEVPEATTEIPQDAPESHTTEETSFLSDFSPSDIDALQDETGEVDPLAEADVYIAYGRYQQAEELIRQAIDRTPERDALKHKLFEILFAIKDADGFTQLAEQSAQQGLDQKDADAWDKVKSMGQQLAPEHLLFAGAAGAAAAAAEESTDTADDLSDLDDEFGLDDSLDLDELSSSVDLIEEETQAELDAVEMSGLNDLLEDDLAATADAETAKDDEMDFDLDLDVGTETQPSLDEASAEGQDLDGDLTTDLDFDMDMPSEEPAQAAMEEDEFAIPMEDLEPGETVDGASVFTIDDPLQAAEVGQLEGEEEDESLADTIADLSQEETTLPEVEGVVTDDEILDESSRLADELEIDDMPGLDNDSAIVAMGGAVETGDAEILSLDDVDETPVAAEEGEPDVPEVELDMNDEINTKLDLAKAYIEMEDEEGARGILDEVLNEGNEGQKAEAQRMMDELG